jgi:hypothetical protein
MKQQDTARNLASARAAVHDASRLVTHPTPEALDQSAALLEQARQRLQAITVAPISPDPEERLQAGASLEGLNRSLERLRGVLDQAASYWAGWIRLKNAMAGGYTGQGEPAQALKTSRLSLEG